MNGAVPVRPSWPGQEKLDRLPLPVPLVMALLISPIPREQKLAPLIPLPCDWTVIFNKHFSSDEFCW